MTKAIESWIYQRVGQCINLESPDVGKKLYDGCLYYNLLYSYNIINKKSLVHPKKKCTQKEALMNIHRLCPWFQLIGISHSTNFLEEVAKKNPSNSLRLLFELYIKLNNAKSGHDLIFSKHDDDIVVPEMPKHEDIQKEMDVQKSTKNKSFNECFALSKSLELKYTQLRDMIVQQCKDECKIKREKFKDKGINKNLKTSTVAKYEPYHIHHIPSIKNIQQMKEFAAYYEAQNLSETAFLECKMKHRADLENSLLKLKMRNLFLHDIWASLLEKREEEFEKAFKKKLHEQSEYERQYAIKLAKIHNSNLEHFERKLKNPSFLKDKVYTEAEMEYINDKKTLREQHNIMFDEKIKKYKSNNYQMCREIVEDLIDLSVIVAEYKQENDMYPSRRVMNDYKELFYKGIPFFLNRDIPISEISEVEEEEEIEIWGESHITDDMVYEDIRAIDTQVLLDRVIMETLNNFYVHSYLYLVDQWMVENWPQLGTGKEVLEIHGFDVHRLLETKYSFPPPPNPAGIDHFKVRAILKYFYDQAFLNCLQELLRNSNVILIKLNDAVNYCIEKYEEENAIVMFGRKEPPKDSKPSSRKSIRRQSARRSSRRSSKRSSTGGKRKSTSAKRQSTSAKRQSASGSKPIPRHSSTTRAVSARSRPKSRRDETFINDKAVQYPSLEDLYRRVNFTDAGKLGKEAQLAVQKGIHLNDLLSSKLMVEYLKSLKGYDGFVLADFPNTVAQATILEFLIAGRPIQVSLKMDDIAKDFIHDALNPPLTLDVRKLINFEGVISKFIQETILEVIPTLHDLRMVEKKRLDDELREMQLEEEEVLVEEEVIEEIQEEEIVEKLSVKSSKKSIKRRKSKKKSIKRQSIKKSKDKKDDEHKAKLKSGIILKPKKSHEKIQEETKPTKEEEEIKLRYAEPVIIPDPNIITVSMEELLNLRTSKILPRPNLFSFVKPIYNTYFDKCLVNFTEAKLPSDKEKKSYASLFCGVKSLSQDQAIGAGAYEELAAPLNFYEYFKVLYSVVHTPDNIPSDRIARLILDETDDINDPKRRDSLELFGGTALEVCSKYKPKVVTRTDPKIGGKSKKSIKKKSIKKKSIAGSRRKSTKGKANKIKKEDSSTASKASKPKEKQKDKSKDKSKEKSTDELEEIQGPGKPKIIKIEHTPPPERPLPGDEGWDFTNEYIPEEIMINLASRWELIEKSYLHGLYQVMQLFRVHNSKYFPYRNFIRDLMEDTLNFVDDRTRIVSEFQTMFNEINNEMRKTPEMKAELECRVYELWNLLCEMSDKKKKNAENVLKTIMDRGWILSYCCTLINIFLSLMQLEADRLVDTIQIFNDYYLNMLKATVDDEPIEKIILERIVIPEEEEKFIKMFEERPEQKIEMEKMIEATLENLNDSIFLKNLDKDFLTNLTIFPIQQISRKAYQCKVKVRSYINNQRIGRELLVTLPRTDKKKQILPNLQKQRVFSMYLPKIYEDKITTVPKLKLKKKPISNKKIKNPINKNIDYGEGLYYEKMDLSNMDRVDTIKWEWFTAVINEINRTAFRIKLIESKMKDDIQEIFDLSAQVYSHFDKDIAVIFHREIRSIEQLCKILRKNIKSETKIRPKLILDGERFYMDNDEYLYPERPPPPPTPVEDVSKEYEFTIEQLENFISKMTYVSPNGILEDSFISILEDMVECTKNNERSYLPKKWGNLNKTDIEYILKQVYGDLNVYDWRDFVIFNLNIELPTINQLLDIKKKYRKLDEEGFENLTFKKYKSVPLWFENNHNFNKKRNESIKKILFNLFQISPDEFNYSSFLFAFCKGEDSTEGFMKALTLVDERGVLSDAENYKKLIDAKEHAQTIADQIIIQVLHNVITATEGVQVTTLPRNFNDFIEDIDLYELEELGEFLQEETNSSIEVWSVITPDPTYPERYVHPKWHICIPYKLVFSLLVLALNFYFLSPIHENRQVELEKNLLELYDQQGRDGYIKAYLLAESDVIKNIFETTGIFKWCNMNYYVEKFVDNKLFAIEQDEKNKYRLS